jgi:hypothetical protein
VEWRGEKLIKKGLLVKAESSLLFRKRRKKLFKKLDTFSEFQIKRKRISLES